MQRSNPPEIEGDVLLEAFGLTGSELADVAAATFKFLQGEDVSSALRVLHQASEETENRICQSLMSQAFSGGFSKAGKYLVTGFVQQKIHAPKRLEDLIGEVIAAAGTHRDLAHWWLFITALAASVRFQTRTCGTCSHEPTMTGALLECLSSKGEEWSKCIQPALDRTGAELRFHSIDLQVLGGEQETGGDFGLILDFDGRTVLPSELDGQDPSGRIVPIILQAKRYTRPYADVSRHNATNGYQKDLLGSNDCASAYIFYEDGGTPIADALPPLVKRVEDVPEYGRTSTLENSIDLASYLLRCATDEAYAPVAKSEEDALRMIYSKAKPGQLRKLVIVSGDPQADNRYSSRLALLAPEINDRNPPATQPITRD